MESRKRLHKIVKAIDNGSLALPKGGITKSWYCYNLDIQQLVWGRNMMDGWKIEVHYGGDHLGTIQMDNNLNEVTIESSNN